MELKEYADVVHRCFRCGYCKFTYDFSYQGFNCPLYSTRRLESCSPGGLMWLIRASLMEGEIAWSDRLTDILYSCTMCRNCVQQCRFSFNHKLVGIFEAARERVIEAGSVPPKVNHFLTAIHGYGNPYKLLRQDRGSWAEGTGIRLYREGDDFLYYVGCVGSYDSTGQRAARALGEVLLKSGLAFGILGSQETCDGNEVNTLGEKGLFEVLKQQNVQTFQNMHVAKIVTLSPHSYNALLNHYPGGFEVFHYTQLLRDLIKGGQLHPSRPFPERVTYHDPCFLARYNQEYEAPREVIRSIPGIELVEMDRNRENAFCCGGGSANFYTDVLGGGRDRPSVARVHEAYSTGATVLAVSCPICLTMLEDAVKTAGLEGQLRVKDVSEIVRESL